MRTSRFSSVNTVDNPLGTVEEMKKAYASMQNFKVNKNSELIFPITQNTYFMAQTLFLNNYEINVIESQYFMMWSHHPDLTYLPKQEILYNFPPHCRDIADYFFRQQVSCNDFVLFVCLFLFFDVPQLITILLTMCKVYSNIFITESQISTFFQLMHLDMDNYEDLKILLIQSQLEIPECCIMFFNLSYSCPSCAFSVKLFQRYFEDSISFTEIIYDFKTQLLKSTIGEDIFLTISKRVEFYYERKPTDPIPKESCLHRLTRKAFTNKPSPYHYDYGVKFPTLKQRDNMVFLIKQSFGYSIRSANSYKKDTISARDVVEKLSYPKLNDYGTLSSTCRKHNQPHRSRGVTYPRTYSKSSATIVPDPFIPNSSDEDESEDHSNDSVNSLPSPMVNENYIAISIAKGRKSK